MPRPFRRAYDQAPEPEFCRTGIWAWRIARPAVCGRRTLVRRVRLPGGARWPPARCAAYGHGYSVGVPVTAARPGAEARRGTGEATTQHISHGGARNARQLQRRAPRVRRPHVAAPPFGAPRWHATFHIWHGLRGNGLWFGARLLWREPHTARRHPAPEGPGKRGHAAGECP